jgi:hypothetical protein
MYLSYQLVFTGKLVIQVEHINYVKKGSVRIIRLKNFIKYFIFGSFIGMLLVYLKFKRIKVEE